MPSYSVNTWLTSIADAGRELVRARLPSRKRTPEELCDDLLSTRGDASGVSLARDLVTACGQMNDEKRLAFFDLLTTQFDVDPARIDTAIAAYRGEPGAANARTLRHAAEAPRHELFRRMNMAPNGTRSLVRMREHLLRLLDDHPQLNPVDADLQELMTGWFNPGFLSLERIDWDSPASLLEKLIRYEKVHRMSGLDDLRRRLGSDRRCFAFFHPALPDEPLIFVQVALVRGIAGAVQPLIDGKAKLGSIDQADTAIFYSISNCQEGLRGVSLGNFLIKLVVDDLARELPKIKTFATLSPVPGFRRWLRQTAEAGDLPIDEPDRTLLARIDDAGWHEDPESAEPLAPVLSRLCAHYLVHEKCHQRPRDPVARFHLNNGARLERINWMADVSTNGIAQSAGILVNYRYDLGAIERNHEAYKNDGVVVMSNAVKSLLPHPDQAAA